MNPDYFDDDDLPSHDFDYEDVTDEPEPSAWAEWIIAGLTSFAIALTIFTVFLAIGSML